MLKRATNLFLEHFTDANRPLAVILAGHNGSGKSTMWKDVMGPQFKMPLINADRMMMSILPEPKPGNTAGTLFLPGWAQDLRDHDERWMAVAQRGVQSFVAQAMASKVSFAIETVFSHWTVKDGIVESKVDLIRQLQDQGYFVLLNFVGLTSVDLSIARVLTRTQIGGHGVPEGKLQARFSRTQIAIKHALNVADAAILVDNSRTPEQAFTLCQFRVGTDILYDIRTDGENHAPEVNTWMSLIAPQSI